MELWTLIALSLAVTPGVTWAIDRVLRIHWSQTMRRSVAWEAVRNPARFAVLVGLMLPGLVLPGWASFEAGWIAAALILVSACVVLAQAVLGPFNRYTGRWYAIDRLLSLALLALVFIHPAAVAPLLVLVMLPKHIVALTFPTGSSPTDGRLPLDVLRVSVAVIWSAGILTLAGWDAPLWAIPTAVLGASAITAGVWYAHAGLAKLRASIDPPHWWERFDLGEMFVAARELGHAGWLSDRRAAAAESFLHRASPALCAVVILVEAAGLLALASPTTGALAFAAIIGMHAAILATTAICFWKWVVIDIAIIACFFALPAEASAALFGLPAVAFMIAALVTAPSWLRPDGLAWISSPLIERNRIEVELRDGSVAELRPGMLAPYDVEFVQNRFGFATEHPTLTDTFGIVDLDAKRQDAIRAADRTSMALVYERLGRRRFDADRARWLGDIVERFADDMSKHHRGLIARWRGFTLTHFMVFPKTTPLDPSQIIGVRVRRQAILLGSGRRDIVAEDIILHRPIGNTCPGNSAPDVSLADAA